MFKKILILFILLFSFNISKGEEFINPKANIPPKAKPNRRTGSESVAPLPLPACPLRRTELKRQPSSPSLIGMISFTDQTYQIINGERKQVDLFPTTQLDIERLMSYANSKLNIRYRYISTSLGNFSYDPSEMPLLYLTGWKPMPKLDDSTIEKLRRYIYDGGTLVIHAQCGRKEFTDSAREQIKRIFPNRELAAIDTDSPLFYSYYPINNMRVRKDSEPFKSIKPYLEGIYVGCRLGIIFSPIDLNMGWDIEKNPIEGSISYHQDDAIALGINIITVTLSNLQYSRSFGNEKIYFQNNEKTRDQLVIGQISHNGDYDPTPNALPNLMKYIQKNTTLNIQFKREIIDLSNDDLFKYSVLYITGLRDFKFSDSEIIRLRKYIESGGILFGDSSAGNKAFDIAFRREIVKVTNKELKLINNDSMIYCMPNSIKTVNYTEIVKVMSPELNIPMLEGIERDGMINVIYSSYGLGNGLEGLNYTYNKGYSNEDSIKLGINILTYGMMH